MNRSAPSRPAAVPASAATAKTLSPVLRTASRASDRVYDELASAIRDLRLTPGQSLSEIDLAEQLHVSRTPLREALARLADAGLIVVVPQVGTRVALIRLHDVEEARFVRESLELSAFEAVCTQPNVDVSILRELLEIQEASHAAGDLDAFFAADEALHAHIFAMSGHPGAWLAVQRMKLQLDRLRRLSLPDPSTTRSLIDEHRLIVEAIEAQNLTDGRALISKHARRVLEAAPALRSRHPNYFIE